MEVITSNVVECFVEIEKIKNLPITKKDKQIKISHLYNNIIRRSSFLVYNNTKRYRRYNNYTDLVQEGFEGLYVATKKFDYRRFPNFFVYAERWVKNRIIRSAKKFDVVYNPNKHRTIYLGEVLCKESCDNSDIDDMEEEFFKRERVKKLLEILEKIPNKNRTIIKQLYGINCQKKSLRQIGKKFGLTHERIRQINNETIRKLKVHFERHENLGL